MTFQTWTLTELDISRSASILSTCYGSEAALIANRLAEKRFDQGDVEGCLVRVRVATAITELERKTTSKSEPVL